MVYLQITGLFLIMWLISGANADTLPHEDLAVCSFETDFRQLKYQSLLSPLPFTDRLPDEIHQDNIRAIEAHSGPYHIDLAPELIALGLSRQEQNHTADATLVFDKALHIIRVNEGLHSARQLSVLELLIETNSKLNRWDAVAGNYDTIQFIIRENYAADDPTILPALKKLRAWHMDAYNKDVNRPLADQFNAASQLYTQAIDIITRCSGDRRHALCFWHRACCDDALPGYGKCTAE